MFVNPYQYTGRDYDSETGLQYYRARYYSSDGGRFLSEDPVKFSGGMDFYTYTGNDPLNWFDPSGLDWIEYTGQALTLYGGTVGNRSQIIQRCKASSGLPGRQNTAFQNVGDAGPVPEGLYRINLALDPHRHIKWGPTDESIPAFGVQWIGDESDDWGTWRARLEKVKLKKPTTRDSMYLHDSQKGYTHGCVETCSSLYDRFVNYHDSGVQYLPVQVRYTTTSTNGGTKR